VQDVGSIRTTTKRETIFVHVFDWPSSALEVNGLEAKVISAHMLANGQPLKFQQAEGKLLIHVPSKAPDPDVTVIALRTL